MSSDDPYDVLGDRGRLMRHEERHDDNRTRMELLHHVPAGPAPHHEATGLGRMAIRAIRDPVRALDALGGFTGFLAA